MLELEALLTQLLPEAGVRGAPFTLNEIAGVLHEAYGSCSYHCVRRAWLSLLESEHSHHLVRPLDGNGREFEFSADAARRIARRAVNGQLPAKYSQTVPKPHAKASRKHKKSFDRKLSAT